MKAQISLVLLLLCGCATEQLRSEPDLLSPAVGQRQADVRPKTKVAKSTKPWPVVLVGFSEPELPAWTVPAPKPTAVLGRALTPVQLFGKVGASIYAVMVSEHFRGSAIAVSSHYAITNCHVVGPDASIVLANATATYRAELVSSDRATDRCYLRVQEGELKPVQGLRDYATLAVGESVFTVGSPKGLVNTLGNGLVSGLRVLENVEYVQITAPVSRGSSGGGLFDDRGNLIGVTTFTVQDSQNLNFAIAASQFWQ
jgi:serine protease Do